MRNGGFSFFRPFYIPITLASRPPTLKAVIKEPSQISKPSLNTGGVKENVLSYGTMAYIHCCPGEVGYIHITVGQRVKKNDFPTLGLPASTIVFLCEDILGGAFLLSAWH